MRGRWDERVGVAYCITSGLYIGDSEGVGPSYAEFEALLESSREVLTARSG